jgi:hypothetical protein
VPAERGASGTVLQAAWERAASEYERTFGHRPTKRLLSEDYFSDANLLARWTGPSDRPHWRFRLEQLVDVTLAFKLAQDEVDDLVIARLSELDPESETMVALSWLSGFLERSSLDDDERAVLKAYRAARGKKALGLYPTSGLPGELEAVMDGVLTDHEKLHVADHSDTRAEVDAPPGAVEALMERALQLGRRVLETHAARLKTNRQAHAEARTETKALLKTLRASRKVGEGVARMERAVKLAGRSKRRPKPSTKPAAPGR